MSTKTREVSLSKNAGKVRAQTAFSDRLNGGREDSLPPFYQSLFPNKRFFFVNSFYSCAVKCGIVCIEIALVLAGLLRYGDSFAEALIVDYLPLAQETYRVDDIRIIHKAEDIVIGQPRLLLCCDILMQICKNIAGNLKRGDGERSP